jgi:hypothetical protein
VKSGTFSALKLKAIQETNNQQYKTPRALRNSELLRFMLQSNIVNDI